MNHDPDPSISKLIDLFKKRDFQKQANLLKEIFFPQSNSNCPICDPLNAEPECVLCEGTGEVIPEIPADDEEDLRVIKELNLPFGK